MDNARAVVIFDFDGTIADSLHLFVDAVNKFSGRFKYKKIRQEELRMLQGKSTHQILKHLGISLLKLPLVLKKVRREVNCGVTQARPSAQIRDVLLELKRGGCKIGILTSNTEQNVKKFLINNGLDVFDFLYSGNSLFGKGRVLRAVIRKNGLHKSRVFYVGDEIRDVDAAKRAGIRMIAVSWGFNTAEALRAESDYTAETPEDIRDIVMDKRE